MKCSNNRSLYKSYSEYKEECKNVEAFNRPVQIINDNWGITKNKFRRCKKKRQNMLMNIQQIVVLFEC